MNTNINSNLKLSALLVFLIVISLTGMCFADEVHGHESSFNAFLLIRPLGISALILLLLTACTGVFRKKLKRRFLKIHKILALLTIAVALSHAVLVIILFG
jgi:hypothetical protein